MANSTIIQTIKNKIIKEIINDELIVKVINSSDVDTDSPDELVNTHIFNYHQDPSVINTAMTFITIQVHIPQPYSSGYSASTFVYPQIEIWIVSHTSHMVIENIPKVKSNRNDYLSMLLDEKFNGRSDFGYGKLSLVSNVEGSYQKGYLYRKMVFDTTDLNDSLCYEDE